MSDIQPNDDGTCSLGGCDACQYVIPGGTYDSDSCVCSLVWNRFVFCFEICPVAHGRLRARVEELKRQADAVYADLSSMAKQRNVAEARVAELEAWHEESSETVANIALDYAQMKIERDTAEQQLRDVVKWGMEYFGESGHLSPFMEKAGYVRCECGGSGRTSHRVIYDAMMQEFVELHRLHQEPCPCVDAGTTGWVPVP